MSRRTVVGALLLALLLAGLGGFLILLLVVACVLDDTAGPHACPRTYVGLVPIGAAALSTGTLVVRAARRTWPEATLTVLASAGMLFVLALVVDQDLGCVP